MKTKKTLLLTSLLLVILTSNLSIAQGDGTKTFTKGMNVINIGIGLGGDYAYWGSGYTETPNIVASFENGTFDNIGPGLISLGGLLSYKGIGNNYSYVNGNTNYNYSQQWAYWILGFRAAYHWNFTTSAKFDPYAGLMLGYYFVNYTFSSNDPNAKQPGDPYYNNYSATYQSYLALSVFLGVRYYVSEKVGLWAELGYGYSTLAIGASFKL